MTQKLKKKSSFPPISTIRGHTNGVLFLYLSSGWCDENWNFYFLYEKKSVSLVLFYVQDG